MCIYIYIYIYTLARLRRDPGVEKQLQMLVEPRAAQEAAPRRQYIMI